MRTLETSRMIKRCRKGLGMSQMDLASRLGHTTPQFISNIERGIALIPAKDVEFVAEILFMPPSTKKQFIAAAMRDASAWWWDRRNENT